MNTTESSLYDRLGGESAITSITTAFYKKALADDELKPFFKETRMEKQLSMQREFLSAAFGGPMTYTGKPLGYAHQGRGITRRHFALFVQYFLDTLREFGVAEEDADTVIARLNTYANEISGISY